MAKLTQPKAVEFLVRLEQATAAGKVPWEAARTEYWFVAQMPRFTYVVNSGDEDDVAPFNFLIYKSQVEGGPVAEWEWGESSEAVRDAIRRLYATVKRRVIGYNDITEGIFLDLAEVEGEVPPGEAGP